VFVIEEGGELRKILSVTNMRHHARVEFAEREGGRLYVSLPSLGFLFDMETGEVRAFRDTRWDYPFSLRGTIEVKPFGGNVYIQPDGLYDDK
jgi:hypothetical protein